jgi:SulP family sulfate permease
VLPTPTLFRCLREGYHAADLRADLAAGLLVGVVALPLSIGLAIASGCSPAQGLVTAIVGGLAVSLLGGSRVQIGGPAGAFVGLCALGVGQFGYGGLAVATLMAGLLILGLGLARLGKAITYIPIPVVIGFTTGIAVVIASTQLAPTLGIIEPAKPLAHVHERLGYLWDHRAEVTVAPLALCLGTMAVIGLLRRLAPRAPGALIAVVVATIAAGFLPVATIHSRFGDLPAGLPAPSLPDLGLGAGWTWSDLINRLRDLSSLALAIALLGSIESLLSAVVADGLSGDRHHSDTELVAQGVANLLSPLFGGLPVTGVIARTSTNIRAGARTPVAGIVHALTILAAVLVAAPLVGHIPLAALAGVLLTVCWHMAEWRHWPHILKAGRSDAFLLPLACGLTVFLDLTWAVVVGVLLAMFFFVRRMAEATTVTRSRERTEAFLTEPLPAGIEVYEVRGPFFFGAATLLRDLDGQLGEHHRALILRLPQVPFVDATAAFGLRDLHASCARRGTRLILCEVGERASQDLRRHGIAALLGTGGLSADLASAVVTARAAL